MSYIDNFKVGDKVIWGGLTLSEVTPEDIQAIRDKATIRKCKTLFKDATPTPEQAQKIIDILEEK